MAVITVSRQMGAPRDQVWEVLADLATHPRWMRDARSVVFVGEQRRGTGTRMEVETRIGPLAIRDVLEVTGWETGHSISVAHWGVVRGDGKISIESAGPGSLVVWREQLVFPWWLGGSMTAWLARPLLAAVWRKNLAKLEELVSSP